MRAPRSCRRTARNPCVTNMGLTVAYQSQAPFAARVKTYSRNWERNVKALGVQAK